MKEKVHQGLTKLVIKNGTCQFSSRHAKQIIYASIEPDLLNKQQIEENIINAPFVLYKWWADHSMFAGDLAMRYLIEAEKAYRLHRSNWSYYLGYTFHFITDRATPFHSPDKIAQITDTIKEQSEPEKEIKGLKIKNQLILKAINTVATFLSKSLDLKIEHDEFESLCEDKWDLRKNLISKMFISRNNLQLSLIKLKLIEEELNYLHERFKDITSEWIDLSNNYERYMVEIASVMELAARFVMKI